MYAPGYYKAIKYYTDKGYRVHVNRYVSDNLVIHVLAECRSLRIAIFFPGSVDEALYEIVRALDYGYDSAMCFVPTTGLANYVKERLEVLRKRGVKVLEEKGRYEVHCTSEFFRGERIVNDETY